MPRRTRALLLACAMLGALAGGAQADDPAQVGQWSAPFAENPAFAARPPATPAESKETPPAVSMVMLPDGRILYWGGLESLEDSSFPLPLDAGRTATDSRSRVLTLGPAGPSWSVPTPETGGQDDMFCSDQRVLFDGRVISAGGTVWRNDPVDLSSVTPDGPGGTAELFGSNATRIFDPTTNIWTQAGHMNHGRWYPTLVTLPDGKLFVASGVGRLLYNTEGTNVQRTEIFDPVVSQWTHNGDSGATTLPLFSRMHLMPDGKVFFGSTGQMFNPMGQSVDEALWNLHKAYDPATNSWAVTGIGSFGARSSAFSVMLPLKPPYAEARMLIAGGTLGTSPSSYIAHNLTEIVTYSGGESSSERGPDLNNRRWYSSGVLLPDGGVVAVSGADKDEVLGPGSEAAVRQAELFDGERWLPLASASRDRTYHNAAILLPDGSVLVAGHSPINMGYGPKGDNTFQAIGNANNLKDPSFEILKPPYLFRGPRPEIEFTQKGIAWTETSPAVFPVGTPDAESIDKVVLMRLPSTTHITDADMRAVELDFEVTGANLLHVTPPPNGNVAPPGYYYLFVLRDNGEGMTPSVAKVVKVGPTPDVGHV